MSIAEKSIAIRQDIATAEQQGNRAPGSVALLLASKKRSVDELKEAIAAGQYAFGESFLQEALPKIQALPHTIQWHFIGSIQKNKTKKIAEYFSWVHSVTNKDVAERLNRQRPLNLPPLNICLEVNISEEISKSGIEAKEIFELAKYCQTLSHLRLRGLMAIPVYQSDFNKQKIEFHKLRLLFDSLNQQGFKLDTLSMGMSDDFAAAIAEGSTMIRIGRRVFGER